jgi:hypothetical protein
LLVYSLYLKQKLSIKFSIDKCNNEGLSILG